MAAKYACVLLALVAVASANTITQLNHDDVTVTHTGFIFDNGFGIAKSWFLDPLQSCHIIFPTGITYEAYPNSNVPETASIYFAYSAQPFTSCHFFFRNAVAGDSGTYQLIAITESASDSSHITVAMQRFHVTVAV